MRHLLPLFVFSASMVACSGGGTGDAGSEQDSGGTPSDGSMTMPETGSDSGSGSSCNPMVKNSCAPGLWCTTTDCATGTCTSAPAASDAKQPICGCDGVTYWNASVAAGAGASQRAAGACTMTAAKCSFNGGQCPMGTFCAFDAMVLAGCSSGMPVGICWGLPASCPQSGDKKRSCAMPQAKCPFECDAMKTQSPYWADPKCP